MKLIGNLKKKVDNAQTNEEVRDAIKKAGMLLDDDELEQISGGAKDPDSRVDTREGNELERKGEIEHLCSFCKLPGPFQFMCEKCPVKPSGMGEMS